MLRAGPLNHSYVVSEQIPTWTRSRKTLARTEQSRIDTIRMDSILDGQNQECIQSRMGPIPNGHNPEWA